MTTIYPPANFYKPYVVAVNANLKDLTADSAAISGNTTTGTLNVGGVVTMDSLTVTNQTATGSLVVHGSAGITDITTTLNTNLDTKLPTEKGVRDYVAATPVAQCLIIPEEYGAAGNGVTDDTVALVSCITEAAAKGDEIIGRRRPYYTAALSASDLYGADFAPQMHIMEGAYLYNPYSRQELVWGKEYLYAWYQKLVNRTAAKVTISGELSVVAATLPTEWLNDVLLKNMAALDGFTNLTFLNRGHANTTTAVWNSTYVDAEIVEAPDLWVLRWGQYDMSSAVTLANTAIAMRAALTKIRAAQPLSGGVGIIMMATHTGHQSDLFDDEHIIKMMKLFKKLSVEFQCAFIDLYGLFQDSKNGASKWFTEAGGVVKTPSYIFAGMIADVEYDVAFPLFARLFNAKMSPQGLTDVTANSMTIGCPAGAVFYIHGETSLNADYCLYHGKVPYIAGTATIVSAKINLASATSVTYYNMLPNLTSGNIMTIRLLYTPLYTGSPVANDIRIVTHSSINNTVTTDLLYLSHVSATGNLKVYCNAGGVNVLDTSLGVWAPVSGTEYEIELNLNLTAGTSRLYIDGVQFGANMAGTGTRTTGNVFLLGNAGAATSSRRCRHIAVFDTVQHTAAYIPEAANKTTITKSAIATPTLTVSGAVTADSLTLNSLSVVGGFTADSITATSIIASNGDVTASGGLTTGSGRIKGKVLTSNIWNKIYTLSTESNDSITINVSTKDDNVADPAAMTFMAGAIPASAVPAFAYSLDSDGIAAQARIAAFTTGTLPPSIEITCHAYTTFADYTGLYPMQTFTALTGKLLYSISLDFYKLGTLCDYTLHVCLGDYDPLNILASSTPVAYLGAWGVTEYLFPTTPHLTANAVYSVTAIPSVVGALTRIFYSNSNIYAGGMAKTYDANTQVITAIPTRDFFFDVKTFPPGTTAVDIYEINPVGSRTDVKIMGCTTAPLWLEEGSGAWPTGHPAGADLCFDTSVPATYPPSIEKALGKVTCYGALTAIKAAAPQAVLAYESTLTNIASLEVGNTGDLTITASGGDVNLAAADQLHVLNNTASSSTATGCATFAGGVGIVGDAYVGGTLYSNGVGQGLPFVVGTVFSGPWAASHTVNVIYSRVGNTVHCHIPNLVFASDSAATIDTAAAAIAVQHRPFEDTNCSVLVSNCNANPTVMGNVSVHNDGHFHIVALVGTTFATTAGDVGLYAVTLTWTVT